MPQRWFRFSRPTPFARSARLTLERLEDRTVPTWLSVGPNINVAQPSASGNQSECTVAMNPTDPSGSNLFAACNLNFYRYSFDGGYSWFPSSLAGIPTPGGDNQAAFDQFGNLFVTYLSAGTVRVVLSVDGGYSFRLVGTFSGAVDQPSLATGPGGEQAFGSVWVSFLQSGSVRAAGAAVNGLDDVGAFSVPQIASPGNFGGTAIGPNGEVSITYQNPAAGPGPSSIIVRTDRDGIGGAGFSSSVIASATNVGGFAPIPAQPGRTIDAEANLAYDYSFSSPFYNRLYLVYTDRPTVQSADTDIFVRLSDDNGFTWTDPILVNDDFSGTSQFLPALAVDQATGWVAVTWYDARRSGTNNRAEIWGSVSLDGGFSWEPNVQIGADLSCGTCAGSFNFGDYDTMDFSWGVFYRIWADNSNPSQLTPPNASSTAQDPGIARVEVYLEFAPGGRPGVGGGHEVWKPMQVPSIDAYVIEALSGAATRHGRSPVVPELFPDRDL